MYKKLFLFINILFLITTAPAVFAGTSAVITLTVTIPAVPDSWLTNISDSPDAFSPNADTICDTTNISYRLINPGFVTITLYNQSGALVRTLKNNLSEPAGIQSVVWDGTNDNGVILEDGPYTYNIEVKDGTEPVPS